MPSVFLSRNLDFCLAWWQNWIDYCKKTILIWTFVLHGDRIELITVKWRNQDILLNWTLLNPLVIENLDNGNHIVSSVITTLYTCDLFLIYKTNAMIKKKRINVINQIFIIIFLLKNIKSRKIYEYKFFETQTHSNESVLGLALARPNYDWAWQCAKSWVHPREWPYHPPWHA